MKQLYLTLVLLSLAISIYSQTELDEITKTNRLTFEYVENEFKGDGWEKIISEIQSHNNTLIGEDHFFNEIPLFVSELISKVKFNNFFCEIDFYSGQYISNKIQTLAADQVDQFLSDYSHAFSFYALEPEYKLLNQLIRDSIQVIGTDQIALTADGLLSHKLKEITKNKTAEQIYSDIELNSKTHFELFTKGEGSPYMFTNEFEHNIAELETLHLSEDEQEIIASLKLSREIYLKQDHHLRIQLMKNRILMNMELVQKEKNLFKYGALHVNKGESLLGGFDIGNFVSNLSDANFDSSLHLMILGKNGVQGVPFKGMEPQKINPSSDDLKHYASFFDASDDIKWSLFDLNNIRKAIKSNGIQIDNKAFLNSLNGFDYIIVIPNVSAPNFLN